jgi:hypothetical protein
MRIFAVLDVSLATLLHARPKRTELYLAALVLFLAVSLPTLAQQKQSPSTCVATEEAVLTAEHQVWSAWGSRDAAAWDKLVDDSFVSTDDGGIREGKQQILAAIKQPEGNVHNETDENPKDVRVVFTNGVAILNFTKHWTDYDKAAGISWGATSANTRVFTCKNGEWKLIIFHETDIPNKDRQPSVSAIAHLDDYVGRYRFSGKADKGVISISRNGKRLIETWTGDKPIEILPGKYDTFFSRHDDSVETFVRDKPGHVTGILYTYIDGQVEAKRID